LADRRGSRNSTAIAIVPLLLIKTKVMIGDQDEWDFLVSDREGEDFAGLGHGTVVDIRVVMYDQQKNSCEDEGVAQEKIHIMAFPRRHS